MRWTNVSAASVTIGPLPAGAKRVALYLPKSPRGADFRVTLDGNTIYTGTTLSNISNWVARAVLPVADGRMLTVIVGKTVAGSTQFSVSGATFFFTP